MQNFWGILTDVAMVVLKRKFLSEANFCSQQIGTGTRGTHFFRTTNTHKPLLSLPPLDGLIIIGTDTHSSLNLPSQIFFTFLFSSCLRQVTMQFFCVCHKQNNRYPWNVFHVYHKERKREKRDEEEKRERKERERTYIKGTGSSLEKQ